jgi:hypothetical protein
MKVEFKYGIKSFSGTLDELNFANHKDRNMVIGREIGHREATDHNHSFGNTLRAISALYKATADGYKADLTAYAKKMYDLPKFSKGLAGNRFNVFVMICYAAMSSEEITFDVNTATIDDFDVITQLHSVKSAVEAGLLDVVVDYDELDNPAKVVE